MSSESSTATPGDVLITAVAPDDAGAETADRYEWQAMMAAADVLSLYLMAVNSEGQFNDNERLLFICEHHEDWAIVDQPAAEIVSGKHREASVGAYSTYLQIIDLGGVLHLYQRWDALEQKPMCRLVTTAGLTNEAAKLSAACELLRGDGSAVSDLIEEVLSKVAYVIGELTKPKNGTATPPAAHVLRRFLACLRFQDSEPRRQHLPDMAAERYGRPVALKLQRPNAAQAIWSAVLALVRPRMRASGPLEGGALPTVLGVAHDDPMKSRTLTLADVHTAVCIAMTYPNSYALLPRKLLGNKMAVKMAEGGCSDNAIERAESLRLQYRRYWRAHRSNPSTLDRQTRLNNALHRLVDQATSVVRVEGQPWGARLWSELDDRAHALEGSSGALSFDAGILLGGISELANNCSAWYSEAFDVVAELRRITQSAQEEA